MDDREREVLRKLRLESTPTEKTLWSGNVEHVAGLNDDVYNRIHNEIWALGADRTDSPPGLVIYGERGMGKTHAMAWTTQACHRAGGYVFNIQPDGNVDTLWTRALSSILSDFNKQLTVELPSGKPRQLGVFLERFTYELGLDESARSILSGQGKADSDTTKKHLRALMEAMRERGYGLGLRNVAVALALTAVFDEDANIAGEAYLRDAEDETDTRREWGLRPIQPPAPREIVEHISFLLSTTGPTVFVVDQIDDMIARSQSSTETASNDAASGDLVAELMSMREKLTRSITIISCLDHTWQVMRRRASGTANDRFREPLGLRPISGPDVGRRLIANHLAPQFRQIGFTAPHQTWPVPADALAWVGGMRPRRLLQIVEKYIHDCAEAQEFLAFPDLDEEAAAPTPAPTQEKIAADRVNDRYLDHCRSIAIDAVKQPGAEWNLAGMLTTAARALLVENGLASAWSVRNMGNGAENPSTHVELTAATGRRVYLRGFNVHNPRAVGSRLDNAISFVDAIDDASLFVVHTNPWKYTPRIVSATTRLLNLGGVLAELAERDLRTLRGVELTASDDTQEIHAWMTDRQLVTNTSFGRQLLTILGPHDRPISSDSTPDEPVAPIANVDVPAVISDPIVPNVSDSVIPFGVTEDGRTLGVDVADMRKHVAVFAGSGSGKTVLLRRIIEEAALRGIGTIVLDPNNDLARLGDEWPTKPDGWWPSDEDRSREYRSNTEVVVWTPGVSKGRPLTLQPFPDFAPVRDDPDELRLAVDTAVASLAPRARIDGESHTADGRRAILRETLQYFATHGGGDLDRVIELLSDPPEEILDLPSAAKHATYVASALAYARSNDPLFDGVGTVFDPDRLLTPTDGYRARVSVINLAGVPDENRPAFINRLQMALFSWIKRNPARDKPLSGLFVMDEAQTFIPSNKTTPCTESTRNLASQARKYGLGLVYATQAPRGIDNRITGNAASHVYGRLTVPAQINAVTEMARARGGEPPKVAALTTGRFYASLEGQPMTPMTVPMCLSHHGSPLEADEIVARARSTG